MSPDERAIRELIAKWMQASQAGDTATVLGLMTDDVVFMVPGQEPFGKQAFQAASADLLMAAMELETACRGDDNAAIESAVLTLHTKYQALEKIFD
jgi:uncharacterized protein (TIGR02246 family)